MATPDELRAELARLGGQWGRLSRSDPRYKADRAYRSAVNRREYVGRSLKATSKGYSGGYSTARRARAAGRPAAGDKTGRRTVVRVAGHTMVSGTGPGAVRSLLARAHQRIAWINLKLPDGQWVKLNRHGGTVGGLLAAAGAAGGLDVYMIGIAGTAGYGLLTEDAGEVEIQVVIED